MCRKHVNLLSILSFSLIFSVSLSLTSPLHAGQNHPVESNPSSDSDFQAKIIQATAEEMSSIENDIRKELASIRQKMAGLEQTRIRTISTAQGKATSDEKGIQFFEKYIKLVQVRYVDEKGNFHSSDKLNDNDQKNINTIFSNYLEFTPLKGSTSAGITVQKMNEGIETLKKQIQNLSKPDVLNNSELAIIKGEEEKYQDRTKVLVGLGTRFGLNLTEGGDTVGSSNSRATSKAGAEK